MRNLVYLFFTALTLSCSASRGLNEHANLKLYGGIMHGGVIDNTDLDAMDQVPVDAYSGATHPGVSVGARYAIPLKNHGLQTGLDLMGNKNSFHYTDDINGYKGSRDLFTIQIRLPFLYSFHLFKNELGVPLVKFNLGLSGGLVFCSELESEGTVPEYEVSPFSLGPALGFEVYPFTFTNQSTLGFSFELYRSMQASYKDFYQQGEMPGISYLRFGIVYGLAPKK